MPRRWRRKLRLPATTSQTVGPFFHLGCAPLYRTELAGRGGRGARVTIQGPVPEADREAVPDAGVAVRQAERCRRFSRRGGQDTTADGSVFVGCSLGPTRAYSTF